MCKMMDLALENIDFNYDFHGKVAMDEIEDITVIHHTSGRKQKNRGQRRDDTRKAKKDRLRVAQLLNKKAKNRKGKDYVTEDSRNHEDRITYSNKLYHRQHNYLLKEEAEWYVFDSPDERIEFICNLLTFTMTTSEDSWFEDSPEAYQQHVLDHFSSRDLQEEIGLKVHIAFDPERHRLAKLYQELNLKLFDLKREITRIENMIIH